MLLLSPPFSLLPPFLLPNTMDLHTWITIESFTVFIISEIRGGKKNKLIELGKKVQINQYNNCNAISC